MTELRRQIIKEIEGTISTVNSSTAALGIDGVFTGTLEEITDYALIYISVTSDQASATDGLSIQQSHDGTNWDFVDTFTIAAGSAKTFSVNPFAKYFRIVYTNGGVGQTHFRLQTIFKQVYCKPSSHRIQDEISSDDDAELVKSALTAKNSGGVFQNLESDTFFPYLVFIDELHHKIHEGDRFTLAFDEDAASLIVAFQVAAGTVRPHLTFRWRSEETATITLYEGASWTTSTGTDVAPLNRARESSNTSILQGDATGSFVSDFVTQDPTGLSGGTVLFAESTWATNQSPASATSGEHEEYVLIPGETYAIELTPSTSGGLWLKLEWYESGGV